MIKFQERGFKAGNLSSFSSVNFSRRVISIFFMTATALLVFIQTSQASDPGVIKNIRVKVDGGALARTNHSVFVAKTANHFDEPPFMNGEPDHISVNFDSDKSNVFDPELHRHLYVYPLLSYAMLFNGKEKVAFDKSLTQLKQIISNKSDRGIKEIPLLPAVEAFQVFHNHAKYLPFKEGSGVAFLTCYAQDEAPIENGNIFYTYQGISGDGKYYVSLTYPVRAKNLPKKAAVKAGIAYLSKLPDDKFTPSLVEIDNMIQSISIK